MHSFILEQSSQLSSRQEYLTIKLFNLKKKKIILQKEIIFFFFFKYNF